MGKRLDTIKEICKNNEFQFPRPVQLLLPTPNNWAAAGIDELIFLAVEQQEVPLHTEQQIAKWIHKNTNGQRNHSQNYISKRITYMNERCFIARNHTWSISKEDGRYKLIDLDDTLRKKRAEIIKSICFDRTTCFRNDPFHGTIFGFKILAEENDLPKQLDAAEKFFRSYFYSCIFDIIKHGNMVYVLLDSSQKLYSSILQRMNAFIDVELLQIKK
jgi:hypothetical protein